MPGGVSKGEKRRAREVAERAQTMAQQLHRNPVRVINPGAPGSAGDWPRENKFGTVCVALQLRCCVLTHPAALPPNFSTNRCFVRRLGVQM